MKINLTLRSHTPKTFRAAKVIGLFDVPDTAQNVNITADLPLEGRQWNIGAIVGASGSGKSTIARQLWPNSTYTNGSHHWEQDCLLDDFPLDLTPDQIISLLTSVGFSSAPAWLRPPTAP